MIIWAGNGHGEHWFSGAGEAPDGRYILTRYEPYAWGLGGSPYSLAVCRKISATDFLWGCSSSTGYSFVSASTLHGDPFQLGPFSSPYKVWSVGSYKIYSNDPNYGPINIDEYDALVGLSLPKKKIFIEPASNESKVTDRVSRQQDGTRIYIRKELS